MSKQIEEVMGRVHDYFVTGTDEARTAIESKLRELLPEWQPIESAPKDFCTEFDGWNGDRVPNICWAHPEYSAKGHYDWCISVYENGYGWVCERVTGLTHWMPLPKDPA